MRPLRLAVTGSQGQVARALAMAGPGRGVEVVAVGRPALDLLDPDTVFPALREAGADVVVSAAAYTAVDRAESDEAAARAVNADGAGAVAAAAARLGVPLIHLSTDYVFDGRADRPYREDDPVNPLGAYGRTKLAGERAVLAAAPSAVILRVAWLYGPFGANFARTMLRLAGSREEARVVDDQRGCPTATLDLAEALIGVALRRRAEPDAAGLKGVFHLVGAGETSWAGLAEAVFAASRARGGPSARVVPIASADYPTPAPRPANSRLDCSRIRAAYGLAMPDWRVSLERTMDRMEPV